MIDLNDKMVFECEKMNNPGCVSGAVIMLAALILAVGKVVVGCWSEATSLQCCDHVRTPHHHVTQHYSTHTHNSTQNTQQRWNIVDSN